MHINTYRWTSGSGWDINLSQDPNIDLVMAFADNPFFAQAKCYEELKNFFPNADIVGCSSSGNINGNSISDEDIVIAAISFSKTKIIVKSKLIEEGDDISSVMTELAKEFPGPKLKHLFVLSDGLSISGSELTKALNVLAVPVTGGLAGDADRFKESWVMVNGPAMQHQIALIGFYGDLTTSFGFATGWHEFGPERRVTRSKGNIVYEIDNKPALEVYTKYLGELSKDLPASGLRYPLSVKDSESGLVYVRTLLRIDAENQSLSFAGDVPEGSSCKLMKTDIDSLIDASIVLAKEIAPLGGAQNSLCLAVSCVGRRLVMNQIAEEEIEAIQDKFGPQTTVFGFYSYGEITPYGAILCSLHNQTTTLTLISE
jgi:hypothetical protein